MPNGVRNLMHHAMIMREPRLMVLAAFGNQNEAEPPPAFAEALPHKAELTSNLGLGLPVLFDGRQLVEGRAASIQSVSRAIPKSRMPLRRDCNRPEPRPGRRAQLRLRTLRPMARTRLHALGAFPARSLDVNRDVERPVRHDVVDHSDHTPLFRPTVETLVVPISFIWGTLHCTQDRSKASSCYGPFDEADRRFQLGPAPKGVDGYRRDPCCMQGLCPGGQWLHTFVPPKCHVVSLVHCFYLVCARWALGQCRPSPGGSPLDGTKGQRQDGDGGTSSGRSALRAPFGAGPLDDCYSRGRRR